MTAVRAFIAIPLPEETQEKIGAIIEQIQTSEQVPVRWVRPQNIHLTLKFLGDVSPSNLQLLESILRGEAGGLSPFEFSIGGLGAFPNPRQPRVIWIGVQAPEALSTLQNRLESETQKLGYAPEQRKFSPHLTLGRVSRNASPAGVHALSTALARLPVARLAAVRVEDIRLFRSDLKPSGAVYTSLFSASLFPQKVDKID